MRAELVEEASCMLEMAAVHMEASRATYAAPVKVGALPRVVGVTPVTSCHTCGTLSSGLRATLVVVDTWSHSSPCGECDHGVAEVQAVASEAQSVPQSAGIEDVTRVDFVT